MIKSPSADARPHLPPIFSSGRYSQTLVWIGIGLLGLIAIGYYNRFARRSHARHETNRTLALPFYNYYRGDPSLYMMGMKPGQSMMFGPGQMTPVHRPLYVANLATHIGDYMISIRQVRCGSNSLYENFPAGISTPTGSKVMVSLQVMAADKQALDRIDSFAPTLRAVTENGEQFSSAGQNIPFQFDNGLGRVLILAGTNTKARYFKRVEGEIFLRSPNRDSQSNNSSPETVLAGSRSSSDSSLRKQMTALAFHIDNVPLPVATHVFGIAAMRRLQPSQLSELNSDGIRESTISPITHESQVTAFQAFHESRVTNHEPRVTVLRGSAAERLRGLFPPFIPDAGLFHLPNRLILQPQVNNVVTLAVDSNGSDTKTSIEALCRLTPYLEPNGEIDAQLRLDPPGSVGHGLQQTLMLWDNEPVVVLLPSRWLFPGSKGLLALQLVLYLDMPPPDQTPTHLFFRQSMTATGQSFGSLEGEVSIRNDPISLGMVRLELWRVEGADASSVNPISTSVVLDKHGHWTLSPLQPGRYRVRIVSAQPYLSRSTVLGTWQDYVQRHDDITRGEWQNQIQDNIQVWAGGSTTLKPWRYEQLQ